MFGKYWEREFTLIGGGFYQLRLEQFYYGDGFIMDKVNTFLKKNLTEYAIIDLLLRVAPWLATLIPASFAYHNALVVIGMGEAMSLIVAAAVEVLGIGAVHTTFQLHEYNKTKRESDPAGPVWVAAAMGVVYLVVVILVNILLDIWPNLVPVAKAVLSLISVPAIFILSIRAQHKRRLFVINEDKVKRHEANELGKLRKRFTSLQARLAKQDELKQSIKELQQERDELKRTVSVLQQERNELKQAETLGFKSSPFWNKLNDKSKRALQYLNDEFQNMDEAAAGVTSKATVSRLVKQLNGASKT